jgi:tripartite-type tricarboxylate transporter receptor subunit TctC
MHAIALLIVLGATLCGTPVRAQSYPARPINMIVPFPPGGNTDIRARALQNEMGKALGQNL